MFVQFFVQIRLLSHDKAFSENVYKNLAGYLLVLNNPWLKRVVFRIKTHVLCILFVSSGLRCDARVLVGTGRFTDSFFDLLQNNFFA